MSKSAGALSVSGASATQNTRSLSRYLFLGAQKPLTEAMARARRVLTLILTAPLNPNPDVDPRSRP